MACLFSDEKRHFFASDLAAQEYPIGALVAAVALMNRASSNS
jgi:hypothetical protein